jgi:hypothetical protein
MSRVGRAAIVLTMALATPVSAATFYVRVSGNDANDGVSPQTAFASIRHAGEFLLNPGDRAIVAPGEYHEGNIAPRRGGVAGQPVAFIADTSGAMTGNPPGPVVVLPAPGKPDETTGFIVFGKQHVLIDGFTVRGGADAGIQVRPAPQTGVNSGDITIVNTAVSDGPKSGIDVDATAPVVVRGNTVHDCGGAGIFVGGDPDTRADAQIEDNVLTRNRYGLILSGVRGGRIESNQLLESAIAIRILGGADLTLQANQIHGSASGILLSSEGGSQPPSNVTVAGNVIEVNGGRALSGAAADSIEITENQFTGAGYGGVYLFMSRATPGMVLVKGNQFSNGRYAVIVSASSVTLQGNSVVGPFIGFQVSAEERAVLMGNTINASARTTRIVAPELVMQENHLTGSPFGILARAQRVTIVGNSIESFSRSGMQLTDTAEGAITGNQITGGDIGISIRAASQPFGSLQVNENVIRMGRGTGIAMVPSRSPAGRIDVVCSRNQVSGNGAGGISIRTHGDIEADDNVITDVGEFGLLLSGARDASAMHALRNMVAGAGGGIAVERARTAELDDNDIRNSTGNGYLVSDSDAVVVARNRVMGTKGAGISVGAAAILRGDCNYDGQVTPEEVVSAVEILFGELPPTECAAIESDPNARVAITDVQAVAINASRGDTAPKAPRSVDIRDNNVTDSGEVGVLAVAADQLMAANNVVQGSGSAGLSVTGRFSADVTVSMNRVEESGADGILSSGARTVEVSGNTVHGGGQSGVRVRDGGNVVVTRNDVQRTAETAILVTGGEALRVAENTVETSSSGGIAAQGLRARTLSATIEQNTLTDVAGVGILFDSAALASATDNHVHNTGLDAVAVRRSDVVHLQSNQADTSGMSGLTIGTSSEPAGEDVVIEGNQFTATHATAVLLSLNGDLVFHENEIHGSAATGVSVVEANSDAVVAVVGNRIGQTMTGGLFVQRAGRAFVFDNVVFSIDFGSGIEVSDSGHVELTNNLAYALDKDGIGLQQVNDARVFNNTVYRTGRFGVALTTATADVFDNIIEQNGAAGLAVLTVTPAVSARYNLNTSTYLGIEPAPTDLASDPLFVDPAGADDILGGAGAADDDFHLRSGDNSTAPSPAIDAGLTTSEALGISGSTASDGGPDTGLTDLGYHYNASPRFP